MTRVDALRGANPAAADLAVLLSTAVRVEPALVRRIRFLLPGADVSAEADLWASDLLASASPLAFSFLPAVAEDLRTALAGPGYDRYRDAAARLITEAHAGMHWSLRLEERINRLMVEGRPGAREEAEQLLYAALAELRATSSDGGSAAIARWLLGALARMSRTAAGTEAGVVASLCAGTELDGRFAPPAGRSSVVETWMPWLLRTAGVERVPISVAFPPGRLDINAPGVTVEVPDTDPLYLEVRWYDGTRTQHQRVTFGRDEYVSLPVVVDRVELETLAGDRYRLYRPTHGARSRIPVQGLDFSAVRAGLRPCYDREALLDQALLAKPWTVIVGPAGTGKSVLLGAVLDRLQRAEYAVAQHFYGVRSTWDEPEVVQASLAAKLRSAVVTDPNWIINQVRAATVAVTVVDDEPRVGVRRVGSGFFVAPGLVLTAAHVLTGKRFGVVWHDSELSATLVQVDADAFDVALLRVEVPVDEVPQVPLATGPPAPGHRVSVFGKATVDRDGTVVDPVPEDEPGFFTIEPGQLVPGMSGGPVLDLDNLEVCGVVVGETRRGGRAVAMPDALAALGQRLPGLVEELRLASDAVRSDVLPGVVIALDGLSSVDPLPDGLPPGVRVLATARTAPDWHSALVIDVADQTLREVCKLMLDAERDKLDLALGADRDAELIDLAGEVPGRLAGIIEWLVDQPVGTARIDDIPVSLTARIADVLQRDLSIDERLLLDALVVAEAGFTVADLALVVRVEALEPTLNRCVALGLVEVDGPVSAPDSAVAPRHPSVRREFTDLFTTGAIFSAHLTHVVAFPHADPSAATPYQIATAATHHADAHQSWVESLARNGMFLDLRHRSAGLAALRADLDLLSAATGNPDVQLLIRAVALVADTLRTEPDHFVDLVFNALCQLGAADLAGSVFENCWPPALRVRAIHQVTGDGPAWARRGPVELAAPWSDTGMIVVSNDAVTLHRGDEAIRLAAAPRPPTAAARWGDWFAVAGEVSITLVHPGSGRTEYLPGIPVPVTCLAAAGDVLVAGLGDGTIATFTRTTDGKVRTGRLLGHAQAVTALSVAPAGLVSASADGTVRVWSLAEARLQRIYRRHHAPVVQLAVLDSGDVVSGDEKGCVRWWNPETCGDRRALVGHSGAVTAIIPVAGGAVVTTGTDGALWRWDLSGSPPDDRAPRTGGPAIQYAVRCPGGVAHWDASGQLTCCDPDGGVLKIVRPLVDFPVRGLLWDAASRTVVVVNAGGLSGFTLPTLPAESRAASLGALAVSADGRYAAVATDHVAGTVDLATGDVVMTSSQPGTPAVDVAFPRPGSNALALVHEDGTAEIAETPQTSRDLITAAPSIVRLAVGHLSGYVTWLQGADGRLHLLDAIAREAVATVEGPRPDTTSLAVTTIGIDHCLAAGDPDGTVRLIRLTDAPVMSVIRAGTGAIDALAFVPSIGALVTGNADGSLIRWTVTNEPIREPVGRHAGPVRGLATTDDGLVVSAGADGTLLLWDPERAERLGIVAGPLGFHAVAAAYDMVVARDGDGRLWVLETAPRPAVSPPRVTVAPGSGEDANWLRFTLPGSGPREMDVALDLIVTAVERVDLRSVRLFATSPQATEPIGEMWLQVDREGQLTDPVGQDGQLRVPRHLTAGRAVRLVVRQRLQVTPSDRDGLRVGLVLGLYSPVQGGTSDVTLSGGFVVDAVKEEPPSMIFARLAGSFQVEPAASQPEPEVG
jgi:WD40 repeat protein